MHSFYWKSLIIYSHPYSIRLFESRFVPCMPRALSSRFYVLKRFNLTIQGVFWYLQNKDTFIEIFRVKWSPFFYLRERDAFIYTSKSITTYSNSKEYKSFVYKRTSYLVRIQYTFCLISVLDKCLKRMWYL